MDWTRPLVALLALGIAVGTLGALYVVLTGTLAGPYVVASAICLVLVVVAVAAMTGLGQAGGGEPRTPYW